jgi:hypothetical protein
MTLLKRLCGLGLLTSLLLLTQANAADHSRSITLQVVVKEHIKLKGSMTTHGLIAIKLADIQHEKPINLGTFGIEASTQANCTIRFSSANNYRLQHTEQANRYLSSYKLNYNGQLINSPTKIIADCNTGNGSLILIPTRSMGNVIPQGVYQDKLRITVTTP